MTVLWPHRILSTMSDFATLFQWLQMLWLYHPSGSPHWRVKRNGLTGVRPLFYFCRRVLFLTFEGYTLITISQARVFPILFPSTLSFLIEMPQGGLPPGTLPQAELWKPHVVQDENSPGGEGAGFPPARPLDLFRLMHPEPQIQPRSQKPRLRGLPPPPQAVSAREPGSQFPPILPEASKASGLQSH